MIVGHGDIGSVLMGIDRPDITFFASGVSDSSCKDIEQYQREIDLLMDQPNYMHIVYFSSLCIYYGDSLYQRHKLTIEEIVKTRFYSYTIVRLGNISWGSNPNTLINYLKAHPDTPIYSTYRFIVSEEEFKYWLGMIRVGVNDIMNMPGRMVFVPDLVKEIKEGRW